MIHKYLFFINQNKVSVLSCDEHLNKLSYETNKGEKSFLIEDDFWSWWIRTASFSSSQDKVDFCFIYDAFHNIMVHGFECVEESSWKYSQIETFFTTMTDYSKVKIKDEQGKWEKHIDQGNLEFTNNEADIFYTTLLGKPKDTEMTRKEEVIKVEEDVEEIQTSPLARLFLEQMQQERYER
ncbi:MAG: hypothetical protein Q4F66_05870 [Clostridium sp.]|nr:hypothetical protein [Clostridium sp.]